MSSTRFVHSIPNSAGLACELIDLFSKFQKPSRQGLFKILLSNNALALDLRDDIQALAPNIPLTFFTALETDLLRNRGPSVFRKTERIRALSALSGVGPQSSGICLLSAEAFCHKTPSLNFWKTHLKHLRKGDAFSKDLLCDILVQLGYLPAELVEQSTQFATRGSIVDVYSPLYERPIRFELFDDQVENIRFFHADSQRSMEEVAEVFLAPVLEFLFPESPKAIEKTRQDMRAHIDTLNWDKETRDAVLSRIHHRSLFPTVDYWAPLISPEYYRGTLFNEITLDAVVECGQVLSELRLSHVSAKNHFDTATQEGEWVPHPDVFLESSETLAQIENSLKESPTIKWFGFRSTSGLNFEPTDRSPSFCQSVDSIIQQLAALRANPQALPFEFLAIKIKEWKSSSQNFVFVSSSLSQIERLAFLLAPHGHTLKTLSSFDELKSLGPFAGCYGVVGNLSGSFHDTRHFDVILTDEQVFGTQKKRRVPKKTTTSSSVRSAFIDQDFLLMDLKIGDFVTHTEHGVGRFLGMKTLSFEGISSELMEIEYKEGSKLLLPVTRLNLVQKYTASGKDSVLDRLGGQSWEAKKSKVRKELESIAGELLHLYSQRELAKAPILDPGNELTNHFAATFPYTETTDQASAIEACLTDLKKTRPMDRLVCGDVGYGKTEVAMRAAHAAAAAGYQVAVLVPTTLLAVQHENTFKKRFFPLGIEVAGISRLKSSKEVRESLEKLKTGALKIIIGTHKLLGKDIAFSRLGLLIVDEEQRFGVTHKEKIKQLRHNVHVLTLTATPIPRTLNMALAGVKDISIITTPPQDRLSIRTHLVRKKPSVIREALQFEIRRGGQVFFLHNRIQTLPKIYDELKSLVPEASIEAVHGQMDPSELEKKMLSFYEGRTQVLLTTAIIESGLDVPNANTLIVDRADNFGLAQLYQIRGRVGRSTQRAHAYFLLPERGEITVDAEERLKVLEAYQELGSGFHIASHDLEIRGSGDFLGREQSGHVATLGFEAYMELLQEALQDIHGIQETPTIEPEINLGIQSSIPESYIPEMNLRLLFYRKMAACAAESEVDDIYNELLDRFGPAPESIQNLSAVMKIKCALKRLRVRALSGGRGGYLLVFDTQTPIKPQKLVENVRQYPAHFQLYPDGKLLIKRPQDQKIGETLSNSRLLRGIEGALSQLETWCE